jgi:putative glutamine amidotransferase
MPAPTIALLVGREPELRYSLHRGYVDAVWAAGAMPVVLAPPPAGADLGRFVEYVASCDALLLTGGGDIDPGAYGEAATVPLMSVDAGRDAAELAATRAALDAGLPILGICRGIQLLAVAGGGALHQDLATAGFTGHHWEEERQHEAVHVVEVSAGTIAASVVPEDRRVNSIHHQGVKAVGADLAITARSEDGVVEAIEGDRVLGVQWHPERLFATDARHLAPFAWLLGAAA